jgi:hypothetical protein
MKPLHWIVLALGCILILLSFMEDFRNTMAGGIPHPFAWPLFTIGELAGAGAFVHAVRTPIPSNP